MTPVHVCEGHARKEHCGDDLIHNALSLVRPLHENADEATTKHC